MFLSYFFSTTSQEGNSLGAMWRLSLWKHSPVWVTALWRLWKKWRSIGTQDNTYEFPYHYGEEAESYSFYRVPKVLFTNTQFKSLSCEAKLLYGLLLDRMQLSIKNRWLDEEGKVYIYFSQEQISGMMGCGLKKVGNLLAELDSRKGIGLITRIRQG